MQCAGHARKCVLQLQLPGASRGRADAPREVRDYVLSYPRCGSHHNSFFLTSIELLLPFVCFLYGRVCYPRAFLFDYLQRLCFIEARRTLLARLYYLGSRALALALALAHCIHTS